MPDAPRPPAHAPGAAPTAGRPAALRAAMLRDVRDGLTRPHKELPPKYFYDLRGSRLFDEITRLPEYYLTRAERALLEATIPRIVADLAPRSLVELGAGSADKTRIILRAMRAGGRAVCYVPLDVSAEFLDDTAVRLRAELPGLEVLPVVADIGAALPIPRSLPSPLLVAFLGSTIGNFEPAAAVALLRRVRGVLGAHDRLLVGVDLRKDPARLEAAYNDARGVTAEFNRNVLRVLDRELGADFVPERFDHRAVYDQVAHRIEMYLVAREAERVTIPGLGVITFAAGEAIRTEISAKFDRASVEEMFACGALRLERWLPDDAGDFALALAAPVVGDR